MICIFAWVFRSLHGEAFSYPLSFVFHFSLLFLSARFGVSHPSEGSSRSSLENGGRERDRGSESDEDEDSPQITSDTGRLDGSHDQEGTEENHLNFGAMLPTFFLLWLRPKVIFILCAGPGWTASFGDAGGTTAAQSQVGWETSAGSGADAQETGWANFTEFQPFCGWESMLLTQLPHFQAGLEFGNRNLLKMDTWRS